MKFPESAFADFFSAGDYARLLQFTSLLKTWNQKFSFTAVPDDEIFQKLIAPSAWLGREISHGQGGLVVDFGCGPGIPGVPMAIADGVNRYLLLDSNAKKIGFIKHIMGIEGLLVGLDKLEARVLRVKDDTQLPLADVLVSRAAGDMAHVISLFQGKMRKGADAYFFKGGDADGEVSALLARFPTTKAEVLNVPEWFTGLKVVHIVNCFT